MVLEVKKALSRNALLAKAVEWSPECKCLDLVCILNHRDLATSATERVKSLMRRTSARLAMERRLSKRKRLSKQISTKEPLTTTNTPSMAKLMSSQAWNQVMLSLLPKSNHTRNTKEREQTS
jgi:hypothetical protein